MTGERSRSSCMNFGSLSRHFLLVKSSFPLGFAVGINFENYTHSEKFLLVSGIQYKDWAVFV